MNPLITNGMDNSIVSAIDPGQPFFNLLMQAPAAIAIVKGPTHIYSFANPIYQKVFARSSVQLLGKTIREVWPEVEYQGIYDVFEQVFNTGEVFKATDFPATFLEEGVTKTGYYDFILQPIKDETGIISDIMIHAVEVTDRVFAKRKAKESEDRFLAAIEAVDSVLWTNNTEGEMDGEQPGWAKLTGQSYEEYQGYGWATAVHPEDATPTINAWQEALKSQSPFLFEHRVKRRDGLWRLFSIRAIPVFTEEGDIKEWVGVHTDITEQRMAERAIRESEQRFQNFIREASVGIIVLMGAEMNVAVVNDAYARLIGRKAEEMYGQNLFAIIPEAEEVFRPIIDQVRLSGNPIYLYDQPYQVFAHGETINGYLNLVYQPYKEADGSITGVMVLCQDITTQVVARKKAEEAQATATLAIASAELGTFDIDIPTNSIVTSARMDEIFDVAHLSERDRYISAIHPEDQSIRLNAYKVAETTGLLEYEGRVVKKDGTTRWIRVKGKNYYNDKRELIRLIGVVQDISEEKQFADELARQVEVRTAELEVSRKALEKYVEDLKHSNRNLEAFAYAASHDMKEPLRKIHFYADRLRLTLHDKLSEEENTLFERLQKSAMRMHSLIDDLLSYSEVNFTETVFTEIDLNELLHGVLDDLEVEIRQKNAVIKTNSLCTIKGHKRRIQQVFQNLLTNALKYSKPDQLPNVTITCHEVTGSEIGVSIIPGDEEKLFYQVAVKDNGIGFEQKDSDLIFNVFTRLHAEHTVRGTGIGLSIVRKIIENHWGYIKAEGFPGEGAIFNLYFPVIQPAN